MIHGIYQGAAAMHALERWQSSIASNLALGSLAGYKKDESRVLGTPAGQVPLDDSQVTRRTGDEMPLHRVTINQAQGALRQTGKDLDVAVQGPGYFQVRTGNGATAYTRNGEFHVDGSGTLVTSSGHQVMGESGPLSFDPTQGPITLLRDGQLSQGDSTVGRLAVFDAAAAGEMQRTSEGLLMPKDGGTPRRVENPDLLQGFVEESNVVPLEEMVNLIEVSRAYDASQKVVTSLDQTTRSAIETLGSA